MDRKELSEVVAEAAARTERAAALQQEAVAEQQKATAEQKALTAMLEKRWAEADARWEREQRENGKVVQTILAELREGRDERRALLEALFRVMDRLPPPPDLRSA